VNSGVFEDDSCLLHEEFCRFLEASGFVEEVIDFYINKERQLLTENGSGTDSTHDRAIEQWVGQSKEVQSRKVNLS